MNRRNWRRVLNGLSASVWKLRTATKDSSSDGPDLELLSDLELERYEHLLTRLAANLPLTHEEEEELEAFYHRPPNNPAPLLRNSTNDQHFRAFQH